MASIRFSNAKPCKSASLVNQMLKETRYLKAMINPKPDTN